MICWGREALYIIQFIAMLNMMKQRVFSLLCFSIENWGKLKNCDHFLRSREGDRKKNLGLIASPHLYEGGRNTIQLVSQFFSLLLKIVIEEVNDFMESWKRDEAADTDLLSKFCWSLVVLAKSELKIEPSFALSLQVLMTALFHRPARPSDVFTSLKNYIMCVHRH
mgnify:CR=1 FL=1